MIGQVTQAGFGFAPEILAKAVKPAKAPAAKAVSLAPYAQLRTGTPVTGIPCQDLTMVPETELVGQTTCVRVNAATAKTLGLTQGADITLKGAGTTCRAKVHIFESVMTGVVSAPLGFGHTAFDVFSQDKGANYLALMTVAEEPGTGMSTWIAAEVTIA
jgi:anaerobic selenocysteine-containing dehydrogenase